MASDTWFLWVFSYAVGEECYTCPLYFKNQSQAEAQINHILSYAKYMKKIDLWECKDGLQFGGACLPYIKGKKDMYRG